MPLPYSDRDVLEWLLEGKHLLYHGPDGWRLGRNEIYAHCGARLMERELIELAHSHLSTTPYSRGSSEVTLYRISDAGRRAIHAETASTLGGHRNPTLPAGRGAVLGADEARSRPHGPRRMTKMSGERCEATLEGERYVCVRGRWFNAVTNIAAPLSLSTRLNELKARG
jgi:hypothetical protein